MEQKKSISDALIGNISSQVSVPLPMANLTKTDNQITKNNSFSSTRWTNRKTTLENWKTLVGGLASLQHSTFTTDTGISTICLCVETFILQQSIALQSTQPFPNYFQQGSDTSTGLARCWWVCMDNCRQDSSADHHTAQSQQNVTTYKCAEGHKGQTSESDSNFASRSALLRVNWT